MNDEEICWNNTLATEKQLRYEPDRGAFMRCCYGETHWFTIIWDIDHDARIFAVIDDMKSAGLIQLVESLHKHNDTLFVTVNHHSLQFPQTMHFRDGCWKVDICPK
jgi:hypothetical protein